MTNTTQSKSELKPTNIPWLGDIPADWEVRRLKSVMNLNPSKCKILDYDESVVFLPMENVTSEGAVDNSTTKPVKDLISGFTYFEKNDVIVAKITPCFENGKGALLDKLETNFGFGSTEFHVLRANLKELLPKYLYLITKSISFREIGEAFMQGSAGQKRITTDFVQNFQIPLPPLEAQQAIVEYLDNKTNLISQFISDKQTMITRLKEQKQSLIHSAVTGKIPLLRGGNEVDGVDIIPKNNNLNTRSNLQSTSPSHSSGTPQEENLFKPTNKIGRAHV